MSIALLTAPLYNLIGWGLVMKINTKVLTAIFVILVLAVLVVLTLQLVKQGGQEPAMPGMSAGEQMERAQDR